MVNQHSDASPPAVRGQTQMLTYWEEQTGKPSRQQRWYQWMSNQDAGPMVGALGLAGKDRAESPLPLIRLYAFLIGQDTYEQLIADNEWIVCNVVLGTVDLGNKDGRTGVSSLCA